MSTPGMIKIEDKRHDKVLYLYTRYDGQIDGIHGLGAFIKGFLPCIVEHYGEDVTIADITNDLYRLSMEHRKGEELEIIVPDKDDDWRYGDYNYHIIIDTKTFKKFEYPVITAIAEEYWDENGTRDTMLYTWEGGE